MLNGQVHGTTQVLLWWEETDYVVDKAAGDMSTYLEFA